jgi:hypothetical protein
MQMLSNPCDSFVYALPIIVRVQEADIRTGIQTRERAAAEVEQRNAKRRLAIVSSRRLDPPRGNADLMGAHDSARAAAR